MALRLDKAVLRGEVDNTERGRVVGKLWLMEREEPVELSLQGNAWRDVAGRKITFTNPRPEGQSRSASLHARQDGLTGDITASKKVKVFTVPEEEWLEAYEERRIKEVPAEWRNAVYLEWFSETNGRVVIESADFEIKISEGAWEMDEAEEEAQKMANLQAMRHWLAEIIQRSEPKADYEYEEGFDDDEDAWEESLKESDRLGDAHMEALEKFGHEAIGDDRVAFVMGWDHMLSGNRKDGADDEEETDEGEIWKAGDEYDFIAEAESEIDEEDTEARRERRERERHPLQRRSSELVIRILKELEDVSREEFGGETGDTPLDLFIRNTMNISGKLAGALNHRDFEDAGSMEMKGYTLAILRRCLNWANGALSALNILMESPALKDRLETLEDYRSELFAIRAGITDLRSDLREDR